MQRFLSIVIILGILFITMFFAQVVYYRFFRGPAPTPKILVTIPEGLTVKDINEKLVKLGILDGGTLRQDLEGYLFPDTYEFFVPSGLTVIEEKFKENFDKRTRSVVDNISAERMNEIIIIASIIEKEVSNSDERKVVSGILWKRLENNIPLQVDSSLCYIKGTPCLPLMKEDKNIDSLYNTYKYRGLPPGPICNPGLDSIEASMKPEGSSYWYYLSDPFTKKTIFAKTLDEHNQNIIKYLGN